MSHRDPWDLEQYALDWRCPRCGTTREEEVFGKPPEGVLVACLGPCDVLWWRVFVREDGETAEVETIEANGWRPSREEGEFYSDTEMDVFTLSDDFTADAIRRAEKDLDIREKLRDIWELKH
jgi:hypothetical protein